MARLLVLLVRTVSIAQNYVLLLHIFVAENNATPDHLGIRTPHLWCIPYPSVFVALPNMDGHLVLSTVVSCFWVLVAHNVQL